MARVFPDGCFPAVVDNAATQQFALAVGVPAVSTLSADIELIGDLAFVGSLEPWLLPLGAYLSGTLTSMGLGRFISL